MGIFNAVKGAYQGFLDNKHHNKPDLYGKKGLSKRTSYAAAVKDRLSYGWNAASTSADGAIYSENKTINNRVREQLRNNPYVKNAQRSITNNVCGTGTKPQLQVKKANGKYDDKKNVAIEKLWRDWSRYDSCCANGRDCFADTERLIVNSLFETGEVFIRLIRKPFGRSKIPLALELIEADQLDDQYIGEKTNKTDNWRMGILRDKFNRAKKYAFFTEHPNDTPFYNYSVNKRHMIIDADEIIHLFIANRIGQTRGVSWMTNALTDMHHLNGFQNAVVIGSRIRASLMGFISTNDPEGLIGDDVMDNERVTDFQAGQFKYLGQNESVTVPDLDNPNSDFAPFLTAMLRALAAGCGVSYESVSKDFSKTNYSSSRLSLLEDRDHYKMIQTYLKDRLFQPLFEIWLELAVASQAIDLPNYELDPEKYRQVHWQFRGWAWIDPQKEVASAKEAVKAGFKTQSEIIAESGRDIHEVMAARKNEVELAEQLGLTFDVNEQTMATQGNIEQSTTESYQDNEEST